MKVLVCGGRNFTRYSLLARTLTQFHGLNKITELCHGGAKGADALSGQWARLNTIPVKVFKADWDRYGRAAGPIRNVTMLKEFKPDIVFAFPGGLGTAHMVKASKNTNVPVVQVNYDD